MNYGKRWYNFVQITIKIWKTHRVFSIIVFTIYLKYISNLTIVISGKCFVIFINIAFIFNIGRENFGEWPVIHQNFPTQISEIHFMWMK